MFARTRTAPISIVSISSREALDWVQFQLEQIPADAPKHEVSARLRALLPLLRTADPVLRDGYAVTEQRRRDDVGPGPCRGDVGSISAPRP